MAQLQSTFMEICRSVGNYVPMNAWIKRATTSKNYNKSGIIFDQVPEAQKQKKDYMIIAEKLEINEFMSLVPEKNGSIKTTKQLSARARNVQKHLRKSGKMTSYRQISENEYRVYRIK